MITPFRLLGLCVVTLLAFYACETSKVTTALSKSNETNYKLEDGSLVVSVRGPLFTIDPFIGSDRRASKKAALSSIKIELIDDCPSSIPDLPSENTLVGEVARTVINDIKPSPRDAFIESLIRPEDKTTKLTVLSSPLVIASKSTNLYSNEIKIKDVISTKKTSTQKMLSLRQARKLAASNPQKGIKELIRLAYDNRASKSKRAEAHFWLAKTHKKINEPLSCFKELKKALEFKPNSAKYLNTYAWFLVTIRPSKFRDPKKALEYAQRAVKLTKRKRANYLDTLAKTQFMLGKLSDALDSQREAVCLAPDNSYFCNRLERYEMAATAD